MATIYDKLNYLNTTKSKIKEAINYDELVEITDDTTFREYADKIRHLEEEYKKFIPTAEIEGEEFSVTDNIPLSAKKLIIDGKCEQETTEGKNLINIPNVYSFTRTNNLPINLPIGTYYVSCGKVTKGGDASPAIGWGGNYIFLVTNMKNIKLNVTEDKTAISLYSNGWDYNVSSVTSIVENLIISSTPIDEYEPYTGEEPSPNPNYPIDVKNIKGYNLCLTNIDDWEIGYYSEKNGQKTTRSYNARIIDLIKIEPNSQLYFNTFLEPYKLIIRTYDKDKNFLRSLGARNNKTSVAINNDEHYISVSIQNPDIQTGDEGQQILNLIMNGEIKPFICLEKYKELPYLPYGCIGIKNSGNNLFNYKDIRTVSKDIIIDEDGWITVSYDNSQSTNDEYFNYWTNNLDLKPNTKYSVILETKNVTGTGKINVTSIQETSTQGQFLDAMGYLFTSLTNNSTIIKKLTTKNNNTGNTNTDFFNAICGLRTFIIFYAGNSGSITFRISVLEDLSITPETFKYEPYREPIITPISLKKKNLFDKDNANVIDGYITASGAFAIGGVYNKIVYIPCKPNTIYTLSKMLQNIEANNRFRICTSSEIPKNGMIADDYYRYSDGTTVTAHTITTGNNAKYLIFFCWSYDSKTPDIPQTSFEEMLDSIKIYEGTSSDDDVELCSIGDTKDELNVTTGVLTKRIGNVVLDGSEEWERTNHVFFTEIIKDYSLNNKPLSNYFIGINNVSSINDMSNKDNNTIAFISNYENYRCYVNSNNFVSVENFTNWLKEQYDNGTPIIIYYVLKKPEQIQLEPTKLKLYEGTNNIELLSTLSTDMYLTYYTNKSQEQNDDLYWYLINKTRKQEEEENNYV